MCEGLIGPLDIKSLAFGGRGVARFSGRVVFVRGAVPGDRLWARLTHEKKRYAEADIERIAEPSPARCTARCPVSGRCGGCQWQMLTYTEQLRCKEQIFADILRRQCGVDAKKISPILESPVEWNYRSRVQFKCQMSVDDHLLIGFYAPGTHSVVDVASCAIAAPVFNALLPLVRSRLQDSSLVKDIPQIDMETDDQNQVRLIFHYTGEDSAGLAAHLSRLSADQPLSVLIQSGRKTSLQLVSGSPHLSIEVDVPPLHLAYAAGGFAQVNLTQNRRLVTEALRMTQPQVGWRVLDLYCGMGNFSLPFARRVAQVVAIEDFNASIAQGRANARSNRIPNSEFHARNAMGACREFAGAAGFDLVLLDPPRTGARDVIPELVRQGVKRILYVSCDPMTLARDMAMLFDNHYTLEESRPIDMFPQNWHLESLSLFVRE